jgi:hypothetical protein
MLQEKDGINPLEKSSPIRILRLTSKVSRKLVASSKTGEETALKKEKV